MRIDLLMSAGRRVARSLERCLGAIDHPVARLLVRPAGIRASGQSGQWTRTDHRRAFAAGWIALVAGWVLAMIVFAIADQRHAGTTWNSVFSFVGLVLCFGAVYAWWRGLKHGRAAFRRVPPAAPAE